MSEKDNSSIIKEYNKELADLDNVEIAGFKGDIKILETAAVMLESSSSWMQSQLQEGSISSMESSMQ